MWNRMVGLSGRLFSWGLVLALVSSCGKSNFSERDAKRSQLTNSAEIKRKELSLVAADYEGTLQQDKGGERRISLRLEVKDIPTAVEGSIDPVMTPILTGYLKFILGSDPNEYLGFGIQKAEFDPKQNKLDIVAAHSEYKEMILALTLSGQNLKGRWTAPAVASSGQATLNRTTLPTLSTAETIRGEYFGILARNGNLRQFGHLSLQTSFQPPEGIRVTGTLKVIFGSANSSEYLTYRFDPTTYNPLVGQLVLKGSGVEVTLTGDLAKGEFSGEWSSIYTGKLGSFRMQKDGSLTLGPSEIAMTTLSGTYQGEIKNTNPASNLPERAMITFIVSQDPTQPNGVKISGNLRLYVGPFGSLEYVEQPFSEVHHNTFTQKLTAKTLGEYRLTIKGDVSGVSIKGTLFADGLGEVADVEVKK